VPIGSVALKSNTPTSKAVVVSFSLSRLDDTTGEHLGVPAPRNLVRNS
jgi:hypothetical protein